MGQSIDPIEKYDGLPLQETIRLEVRVTSIKGFFSTLWVGWQGFTPQFPQMVTYLL